MPMVSERIRAQLRDVDQRARQTVEGARSSARNAIQRARYRRALKRDERGSLRERLRRDADRSRRDTEPGTEAGDRLRESTSGLRSLLSSAASATSSLATEQRAVGSTQSDETAERAYQAAMVSPPTDAGIQPVTDQGLGTFADFARGQRPGDGVERYQQVTNSSQTLRWQAVHDDGATTTVTATKSGAGWTIKATEMSAAGRQNGDYLIDQGLQSRQEARSRALDWIERHPDGIPLFAGAGGGGLGGFAAGGGLAGSSLTFEAGALGGPMDGAERGGELVDSDDLDFVFGGGSE